LEDEESISLNDSDEGSINNTMGFLDGLQAKMKKHKNGKLSPTKNNIDKVNLEASDDGTSIVSASSSEDN